MVAGIIPFSDVLQQLVKTERTQLATHYPKTDKAATIMLTPNGFVVLKPPPVEKDEDDPIQPAISAIELTLRGCIERNQPRFAQPQLPTDITTGGDPFAIEAKSPAVSTKSYDRNMAKLRLYALIWDPEEGVMLLDLKESTVKCLALP